MTFFTISKLLEWDNILMFLSQAINVFCTRRILLRMELWPNSWVSKPCKFQYHSTIRAFSPGPEKTSKVLSFGCRGALIEILNLQLGYRASKKHITPDKRQKTILCLARHAWKKAKSSIFLLVLFWKYDFESFECRFSDAYPLHFLFMIESLIQLTSIEVLCILFPVACSWVDQFGCFQRSVKVLGFLTRPWIWRLGLCRRLTLCTLKTSHLGFHSSNLIPTFTDIFFWDTIFVHSFFKKQHSTTFYSREWRNFFISVREVVYSCADVIFNYFARKKLLFWHELF